MAPGVGGELAGVVGRLTEEVQPVVGDVVPLLAGHLARLAADADRRVGEEAHPGLRAYRGRPPGRMSQVEVLYSLMCTLLSSTSGSSSLAASPVTRPERPQW